MRKGAGPILVVVHLGAEMLFGISTGRFHRRTYGHVGHATTTRFRFLNSERAGPFCTGIVGATGPQSSFQFGEPHHFCARQ